MNLDFLAIEFLNNQLGDYLLAAAIFVVGILSIKVLKRLGFRNLKKWVAKTQNVYDDVLIKILERNLIPIAYLGTFYLAVNNLSLHSILDRSVEVFVVIVSTILAIRLLTYSIEYLIKIYWLNYHRDNQNIEQSIDALVPAIRVVIWGIGAIFLLDNIGFDISAIVASVGIGGVAIALASQGLLQDLFSYFAILFDRPFELGDFISVGDYVGTIEHEGIAKDTIRTGDRELINYSSYNYLGMSGDHIVTEAAQRAIAEYGTSVSASRLLSGERPLHLELEREIADFIGTEDAIAYVGGHGLTFHQNYK